MFFFIQLILSTNLILIELAIHEVKEASFATILSILYAYENV